MTFNFSTAITRLPPQSCSQGITTSNLGPPDYAKLLIQHAAYVQALRSLGLEVVVLDAVEKYPDSYFVEDCALVFPELAVLTRSGAPARRGEEKLIEPVLSPYRRLVTLQEPATLDGGDVLVVDRRVFVGLSERTNQAGFDQLEKYLSPFEYRLTPVQVAAGLHLKSSLNYIGKDTYLVTNEFASSPELEGLKKIVVDLDEAYAANSLLVNDCLLTPAGFPHTRAALQEHGLPVIELEMSEVRKMDGGLTCLSLRFL